ncbi:MULTISPECIES: NADP(H)-dependent aldo-keto reductase [unclassified Pseudomonas]|uniref:NADP(H)-dependent aldo-keto reductase n=1 Tax=unclassified Pseudomonas TaxID=196821 RepID=UPI000BDCB09B|nr:MULTISPECIES: NADP(H)-dependent aldo-keto reductase [unclassified Pseudomonas]PVZ20140.1 aryl-alcohol dehydrogenase-like predicted oxidoreductase [Pseudomonas sp. URIL14HWK12:I12]PVZ27206.1 aryl-alcohol dehydrogenase-like predicted oxidoreductase [Pseudomonas sp. URIL14HWK12:I10]PVZ38095.1 aryl-alcohol dehydrogenase-like predicted oxidoreductase [Pseudomonas sp. URIL14HWK12:I11]SNZ04575.1 Predicted oxidoreductase [Pseudomonas sp. URIL14HWK12:I9]
MEYRELGRTGLKVSAITLGTMTWGEQNTEAEAFEQIRMAKDAQVNVLDTAEMYPVPPGGETYATTERIIGNYFKRYGDRADWVLASKVVGPGRMDHIRDGNLRLDRKNITQALEASLKRLNTDYLDLYQLHWPDRKANYFGQLGYTHDPADHSTPIEETLEVLDELVKAGKVRHIGLSNETPWGTMRFAHLAESRGWPRVVSIQNPYNLLNRTFEVGLAEIALREQIGLLAYSPLAFGVLAGKYLNGARPAKARLTLFERFQRYNNPQAVAATQAYVELANQHGLDPAQMALAFVTQQPFVTSNIIGATSLEQLASNLESATLVLPPQVLEGIEAIHQRHPNPAP